MRRAFTIEDLLAWAYCDELPKDGDSGRNGFIPPGGMGNGMAGVMAIGLLGTRVDSAPNNRFGVVPDFGARDEPHPAAIALHGLVSTLDDMVLDFAGWQAFPEWAAQGEELEALTSASNAGLWMVKAAPAASGGECRLKVSPAWLCRRAATLGAPAGWAMDRPEWRVVSSPFGQPMWFRMADVAIDWDTRGVAIQWERREVSGYNTKGQRPFPGAYRKYELSENPAHVARARAEYQIWRAALDVLLEAINIGSWFIDDDEVMWPGDVVALPSKAPWQPWVDGIPQAARVLHDLRQSPLARSAGRRGNARRQKMPKA